MATIIFLIICIIISVVSYQSHWKKIERQFECINYENYSLIKASPFSEECSTYEILQKENEIWFKKDGNSLFYIQAKSEDPKNVALIGLDGYGIRNMEFKKYVCKLVQRIKIKHNNTN
ncbi:hypothetical protein ACWGOQ_0021440 [Aquimarina sp. M1]